MNKNKNETNYCGKDIIITSLLFVIVILILIIVWALATKSNEQFFAEFSFAATISSIILSLIAIIMSIAGSARMELLYNSTENEVKEIIKIRKNINNLLGKMTIKIDSIKSDTGTIRAHIDIKNNKNYAITNTPDKTRKGDSIEDIKIQGKPFVNDDKEGE